MNLAFLTPSPGLASASPLEAELTAAGARFEVREGWRVATHFADPEEEARALNESLGWADLSHIRKEEVHGRHELALGTARRDGEAWWCPITRTRGLVLGGGPPAGGAAIDVSTQYGALLLAGPAARETLARFCALDLRPRAAPPAAFRPGSVARTPGAILVTAPERFLLVFGAALATYIWTVVADAGARLGGRPVGLDAIRARELSHA